MELDNSLWSGAAVGAGGGAATAALLSYLYYRRKKNQSRMSRVLKTLGWTAAGALAGGTIGGYIWQMRARHKLYQDAMNDSYEKDPSKRDPGRLFYVNFPENRYQDGPRIGHSGLVSISNDGKMRFYSLTNADEDVGRAEVESARADLAAMAAQLESQGPGADRGAYERMAARVAKMEELVDRGALPLIEEQTYSDRDYGKMSKNDLADVLLGISEENGWGDKVSIMGGKVNDVGRVMRAAQHLYDKNLDSGSYNVIPGRFNCGTFARDVFDICNSDGPFGAASHQLNMAWGGTPAANAPSAMFGLSEFTKKRQQ